MTTNCPDYTPFALYADQAGGRDIDARLDFVLEDPPAELLAAWTPEHLDFDSKSTWAIRALGHESPWSYHLGPTPVNGKDPPLFHILTDANWSHAKVYLGKNFGRRLDGRHLYPIDEIFMLHLLHEHDGFVVHASGSQVDGSGILFLGDSGVGKSTIAEFFEAAVGYGHIFSDDRLIIRRIDGVWMMFGSPWHGTFPRTLARGMPIAALYFLEQAPQHGLTPLGRNEVFRRLLPVSLGNWWALHQRDAHLLRVCDLAADKASHCWRLAFANDASVVDFVRSHSAQIATARPAHPLDISR